MKKIGLLSDTHSYWDSKFAYYFFDCDEIWHAGDIGDEKILDRLRLLKTVRAVHGNIDGSFLRSVCPKILCFKLEEVDVFLTHIENYSDKYDFRFRDDLSEGLKCVDTAIDSIQAMSDGLDVPPLSRPPEEYERQTYGAENDRYFDYNNSSKLFVCGHSHILKIMYDKHLRMLCINPGASGKYGSHQKRTLLRFVIDRTKIKNMEIIELR